MYMNIHICTYMYMYFTHANYLYMYLIDEVATAGIPKIHKGTRRGINCWVQAIMCSRSLVVYYPCSKSIGGWEDSDCHDMHTVVQHKVCILLSFLSLLNYYHTTQQLARSHSHTLLY